MPEYEKVSVDGPEPRRRGTVVVKHRQHPLLCPTCNQPVEVVLTCGCTEQRDIEEAKTVVRWVVMDNFGILWPGIFKDEQEATCCARQIGAVARRCTLTVHDDEKPGGNGLLPDPDKIAIRVPPRCLICHAKWVGGCEPPYDEIKNACRVFYECGASFSATWIGMGAYQILFKNCREDVSADA
jgi:hypothetical protein